MRLHRASFRIAGLATAACLTLVLTGCSDDAADVRNLGGTASDPNAASGTGASAALATPTGTPGTGSSRVNVAASDTTCALDPAEVPSGVVKLAIDPKGPATAEVYILDSKKQVVTERESVVAGTPVELTSELPEGDYTISCRPKERGTIDSALKVTAGAATALSAEEQTVVDAYRTYVTDQVADTVTKTKQLVAAVKAGEVAKAKSLYAPSRFGWESIEPVAEAFGDIDPKVDLREADLEAGDTWTGWHVIEKSLWADESTEGMGAVGDQLLTDLDELVKRIPDADLTPSGMANGAKELLDEVASGKITGEEEAFSHTDLVDFKANLDGARKVFDLLRPIAEQKDAALVTTLATEFDDVDAALKQYEKGDGYVSYDTVTEAQRKVLTDVVNALGEPLSKLAAAVV